MYFRYWVIAPASGSLHHIFERAGYVSFENRGSSTVVTFTNRDFKNRWKNQRQEVLEEIDGTIAIASAAESATSAGIVPKPN